MLRRRFMTRRLPINEGATVIEYEAMTKITPYDSDAFGGATIVSNEWDEITQKGVITFNKKVTEIGNGAFNGCQDLNSIIIPEGITRLGSGCFNGCWNLQTIVIPESVIYIGSYCFAETWLKSFTVHAGLYIDGTAFSFSGLETLIFLDGVTEIGSWAFVECFSLTTVILSNSITQIGDNAFYYCESLSSITIPDSITSIGFEAFSGCSSLSEITCLAVTAPSIGSYTFDNVNSNGVLKYPSGSDYSSWLQTEEGYLGYYNWTGQEI